MPFAIVVQPVPEKERVTPRANPVVVVVFRPNSRIPSHKKIKISQCTLIWPFPVDAKPICSRASSRAPFNSSCRHLLFSRSVCFNVSVRRLFTVRDGVHLRLSKRCSGLSCSSVFASSLRVESISEFQHGAAHSPSCVCSSLGKHQSWSSGQVVPRKTCCAVHHLFVHPTHLVRTYGAHCGLPVNLRHSAELSEFSSSKTVVELASFCSGVLRRL